MFRALPCYTPRQASERCKAITLDEFSSRIKAHDPLATSLLVKFKNLIAQTEANRQSAHLIEWDDGLMVLIISPYAKKLSDLTCYTLAAAYCHAFNSGDMYYFDQNDQNDQDASLVSKRYKLAMLQMAKPNHNKTAKNTLKNHKNKLKKWFFVNIKGKIYARNILDKGAQLFLLGPIFTVELDFSIITTPKGWMPSFYVRIDAAHFDGLRRYYYSRSVAKTIADDLCSIPELCFASHSQRVLDALTCYLANKIEERASVRSFGLYLSKYGHPLKQSR